MKQLAKKVDEIKYLDFGLVSLVDTIAFPNALSAIPQYWIPNWSLKKYQERIPIKADAYILLLNKHGQIIEHLSSELNQVLIKEILEFMVANNNKRIYIASNTGNPSLR